MGRKKKVIFIALAFVMIAVIAGVSLKSYIGQAAQSALMEIPEWDTSPAITAGSGSMQPTFVGQENLVATKDFDEINRFDIVIVELTDTQRYYTKKLSPYMTYYLQQSGEILAYESAYEQVEEGHTIVKRVVGLPGDILLIWKGHLYINWERVDEEYDWTTEQSKLLSRPYTLGENEYFIMGDNRAKNMSYDSRCFGAITYDQIVLLTIGKTVDVDEELLTGRYSDISITQFAQYKDNGKTYLVDIYGEYGDWEYGDVVAVLGDGGEMSTYCLIGLPGDEIEVSSLCVYRNGEETGFYQINAGFSSSTITLGDDEYYVISADWSIGKVVSENEIVGVVVASAV